MEPKEVEKTEIACTHVTAAVHILGDKWTAHIIRVLADAPLRFCRIQESAGGINPRTLTDRLGRLEHCGVLERHTADDEATHAAYRLTKKGRDLLPILRAMAAWGDKYSASE